MCQCFWSINNTDNTIIVIFTVTVIMMLNFHAVTSPALQYVIDAKCFGWRGRKGRYGKILGHYEGCTVKWLIGKLSLPRIAYKLGNRAKILRQLLAFLVTVLSKQLEIFIWVYVNWKQSKKKKKKSSWSICSL